MDYKIRKINDNEIKFLDSFLYEAIYVPEEVQPPPKAIINTSELQVYISDFGKRKDDICFVAEINGIIGGAVWVRVMNRMLVELKKMGFTRTSLAVQKANYAVKIYKSVGFEIVDENEEEYIMVCQLN